MLMISEFLRKWSLLNTQFGWSSRNSRKCSIWHDVMPRWFKMLSNELIYTDISRCYWEELPPYHFFKKASTAKAVGLVHYSLGKIDKQIPVRVVLFFSCRFRLNSNSSHAFDSSEIYRGMVISSISGHIRMVISAHCSCSRIAISPILICSSSPAEFLMTRKVLLRAAGRHVFARRIGRSQVFHGRLLSAGFSH